MHTFHMINGTIFMTATWRSTLLASGRRWRHRWRR